MGFINRVLFPGVFSETGIEPAKEILTAVGGENN
jgi:hypothetical protein